MSNSIPRDQPALLDHNRIELKLLTRRNLFSRDCGKNLLEVLDGHAYLLTGKWGHEEPLRSGLPDHAADLLPDWTHPFFWKDARAEVQGTVWAGTSSTHSTLKISIGERTLSRLDLPNLLVSLGEITEPDYGYCYAVPQPHLLDEAERRLIRLFSQGGVSTHILKTGVPDVCSVNLFGQPYSELIRKEGDLPNGWQAEMLGSNLFSVRLASSWRLATLQEQRPTVRAYIGESIFGDPADPAAVVPDFGLEESEARKQAQAFWASMMD